MTRTQQADAPRQERTRPRWRRRVLVPAVVLPGSTADRVAASVSVPLLGDFRASARVTEEAHNSIALTSVRVGHGQARGAGRVSRCRPRELTP